MLANSFSQIGGTQDQQKTLSQKKGRVVEEDIQNQPLASTYSCTHTCTQMSKMYPKNMACAKLLYVCVHTHTYKYKASSSTPELLSLS